MANSFSHTSVFLAADLPAPSLQTVGTDQVSRRSASVATAAGQLLQDERVSLALDADLSLLHMPG